jgi:hypothetical protein
MIRKQKGREEREEREVREKRKKERERKEKEKRKKRERKEEEMWMYQSAVGSYWRARMEGLNVWNWCNRMHSTPAE